MEYHAHFTPSLMSSGALEATFVQGQERAGRIMELIRESALTKSKHHSLVVGPRGIGKTHLISLLYHRVRAATELRDLFGIAWLREEEWGVSSFLDLLVRILRALMNEYGDTKLREDVEELYDLDRPTAADAAQRVLRRWLSGRTLLLVVENLEDLFESIELEGQRRLRTLVQDGLPVSILATTPALFQGVSSRRSPFFGSFHVHHLERLGFEEAADMVVRSLSYRGNEELAERIASGRGKARIRVVHHLAGGNPRVYSIFAQFLDADSLDQLVDTVLRTLDDLTPYYREKFVQLAPLQRKIVEALCETRGALPVQTIARHCFVSQQTASRQLTTLRRLGYVVHETYGRQSYYELGEPLMRLTVEIKKSRGEPVRLLVDFLRLWFSSADLESRLIDIRSEHTIDRRYLERALESPNVAEDPPEVARKWKACRGLIYEGDFKEALKAAEELIKLRGDAVDWYRTGYCLFKLGDFEAAFKALGKALQFDPLLARAWDLRGVLLYDMGHLQEALDSFEKALEIEPDDGPIHNNLGAALIDSGEYEKARKAVMKAIDLTPQDPLAHLNLGRLLEAQGEREEATASWGRALELAENDAWYWQNRGWYRWQQGQQGEAMDELTSAIERRPGMPEAWLCCGFVLLDQGLFDLAAACCRKAMELGTSNVRVLMDFAVFLYRCGKRNEALSTLEKAQGIALEDGWPMSQLLNNKGVALFSLGRYEDALSTYDSAIRVRKADDYTDLCPWFNRASALVALNRKEEGRAALDEALDLLAATRETQTGDDTAIVRNLLMSVEEPDGWGRFLDTWIDSFGAHLALAILGHGLVHSIPVATSEWLPMDRARAWLRTWSGAVERIPELLLPRRLLGAAVEYRGSSDPRVLYSLPKEEREILQPLLRIARGSQERFVGPVRRLLRSRPPEGQDVQADETAVA